MSKQTVINVSTFGSSLPDIYTPTFFSGDTEYRRLGKPLYAWFDAATIKGPDVRVQFCAAIAQRVSDGRWMSFLATNLMNFNSHMTQQWADKELADLQIQKPDQYMTVSVNSQIIPLTKYDEAIIEQMIRYYFPTRVTDAAVKTLFITADSIALIEATE